MPDVELVDPIPYSALWPWASLLLVAARAARHADVTARMHRLGVTSVTVESTHDVADELVALLGKGRRAGR